MLMDAQQFLNEAGTFFVPTPAKYKKEFPFLKEVDSGALCNTQLDLQDANDHHGRTNLIPHAFFRRYVRLHAFVRDRYYRCWGAGCEPMC